MIRTIMAFDIATHTGVAFGIVGETPRSTTIDLGQGKSQALRFAKAIKTTKHLITRYKPDLVVYEAPIGGKFSSQFLVGLAACVTGQASIECKKPPVKLNIGAVRKHFLGRNVTTRDFPGMSKANAKKAIKQVVIGRCTLLGWKVDSDDAADACALWDYACAHYAKAQAAPLGGLFHGS